ncbi:disulfide oxidoreductase [Candidatus Epulonipiscium fishelsonii]|uniref:Disulfide oxidoreductase n=1 Tax=Candidatus Epulonipiscium fishelsonii TaxID=77094 RepID=A0ACC8XH38_9FIRM|nr:disulfide oxidoreductase [Epulopiscium sp. SCG-B05WGA-EpuloA1]ONI43014.1 disulfide oxidoreductase [Epulopiscium sp. SCG-B11WGA-EpuloA1]
MTVSKDMMISQIVQMGDAELIKILMNVGMHCFGCPSAQMETLGQACAAHEVNADAIVEQMNNYLATK